MLEFQHKYSTLNLIIKVISLIDERKTVEVKFGVALAREVDAVRIIGTQLGRDDASAKGAFAGALCTYQ